MRDYDNFNNEQEDEEKHKSLGGSNSIYKRYNNTVYNFKKNIEEKNGFLSRELNNIKNLVLSGKAYYAVDSNDYNNNYKKFVEDNLEKSGSIEWNKTIVIFGLFLASILTYGFSKMSMTEMNSKYIKGFFIVINLVIAITYNILFKENADNYKNLVEKNTQFSILLELLSIFILFSFFFGCKYFIRARVSVIGEPSNKRFEITSSLLFISMSIVSLFCLIFNYNKLITNKSTHLYFKNNAEKSRKEVHKNIITNYITNFVIRISIITLILFVIFYTYKKQLKCRTDIMESMSV